MNKYILRFKSNEFAKNVIILLTGSIGAQIIVLLLSPLITRIYGPETFGLVGTFNSIINILIPISALAYPLAIVLPKKDKDAFHLMVLSLLMSVIISFTLLLIYFLLKDEVISTMKLQEIAVFLYFIPIIIIFASIMQVLEQWFIRKSYYKVSSKTNFYQAFLTEFSKVGIGWFYPKAIILVFLTTIKDGLRSSLMIIMLKKQKNINTSFLKKINKKRLIFVMKKYKDFPLYRAPQRFISAITQGLPVLLLTNLFGLAAAGFYTIGRTVLLLPSQLIGKSFEDVFYPKIARRANTNKDISSLIIKATLALIVVGLFPFGVVMFFGPKLFSIIFGMEWMKSGMYAQWISLWAFTNFIIRPSVNALNVIGAQRFHLIYTIITLLIRVFGIIIGYVLYSNDLIAIALFSLTGAVLNVLLVFLTLYFIKIKKKGNSYV